MHVGERIRGQFLVDRVGAGLGLPRDEARETMGGEVAGREMDAALDVGVEAAAVDVDDRRRAGLGIGELLRFRQRRAVLRPDASLSDCVAGGGGRSRRDVRGFEPVTVCCGEEIVGEDGSPRRPFRDTASKISRACRNPGEPRSSPRGPVPRFRGRSAAAAVGKRRCGDCASAAEDPNPNAAPAARGGKEGRVRSCTSFNHHQWLSSGLTPGRGCTLVGPLKS